MKLKDAINSRTLLIPSLALNVALLALDACLVTRIQNLYAQMTETAAGAAAPRDSRLLFSAPTGSFLRQRGDEARAPLVSEIRMDPLHHDGQLVTKADQKNQVDEQPGQPRH